MTIQNKRIFTSILFVLISFVCFSAGLGDPQPPAPGPTPPALLPIDGGILLGAVFALFYGVRKMLFKKGTN